MTFPVSRSTSIVLPEASFRCEVSRGAAMCSAASMLGVTAPVTTNSRLKIERRIFTQVNSLEAGETLELRVVLKKTLHFMSMAEESARCLRTKDFIKINSQVVPILYQLA